MALATAGRLPAQSTDFIMFKRRVRIFSGWDVLLMMIAEIAPGEQRAIEGKPRLPMPSKRVLPTQSGESIEVGVGRDESATVLHRDCGVVRIGYQLAGGA